MFLTTCSSNCHIQTPWISKKAKATVEICSHSRQNY